MRRFQMWARGVDRPRFRRPDLGGLHRHQKQAGFERAAFPRAIR